MMSEKKNSVPKEIREVEDLIFFLSTKKIVVDVDEKEKRKINRHYGKGGFNRLWEILIEHPHPCFKFIFREAEAPIYCLVDETKTIVLNLATFKFADELAKMASANGESGISMATT